MDCRGEALAPQCTSCPQGILWPIHPRFGRPQPAAALRVFAATSRCSGRQQQL